VLRLFLFIHTGKCSLPSTVWLILLSRFLSFSIGRFQDLCFLEVTSGARQEARALRRPCRLLPKVACYGMLPIWRHCMCLALCFLESFLKLKWSDSFSILSVWRSCHNALQYTLCLKTTDRREDVRSRTLCCGNTRRNKGQRPVTESRQSISKCDGRHELIQQGYPVHTVANSLPKRLTTARHRVTNFTTMSTKTLEF